MKNSYSHSMITLGIVEDDADVRESLRVYFSRQRSYECEITAQSVEEFLSAVYQKEMPDVVLMDIGLPGMSGIDGAKRVKERSPDVEVVMLTNYEDADKIFQSLQAGATGYLLKSAPLAKIKESIDLLRSGGAPMTPRIARKVIDFFHQKKSQQKRSPLTEREKDIVTGLVDGLSYKMIADRHSITIETVRQHIKNIYRKLQVHSKAEVITRSLRGEV